MQLSTLWYLNINWSYIYIKYLCKYTYLLELYAVREKCNKTLNPEKSNFKIKL